MHLLAAERGTVADGAEAVDLRQSPADLLVLSAADTELASLAAAANRLGDAAPALRLANLLRLRHPMSADLHAERTAAHARLIVLRLLGGAAYWRHGLERLAALARERGILFAALPGDDRPDPELDALSTLPLPDRHRLGRYLAEGGAENAANFLLACRALIRGERELPPEARPVLKAGVLNGWAERRGEQQPRLRPLRSDDGNAPPTPRPYPISPARGEIGQGRITARAPLAAVVFYRALVQSGQTEVVEALCEALRERGLDPLPVYVTSLKDPVSVATLRALFARTPPAVVVNLTGFAVGSEGGTVLDEGGAMVLQAALGSTSEAEWRASARGLGARDLAMAVALPEIDGRVFAGALAFKSAETWDARSEIDVVRHVAVADRVAHVADLAANWVRLRRTPAAGRRVAMVLANYPIRDGRIANGVGLDAPAGAVAALRALREAGYRVDGLPASGNALIEALLRGPTNRGVAGREVSEWLAPDAYARCFAALPEAVRRAVTERWGAPEADPFFVTGSGFALAAIRLGHVAVAIQPARGYEIDPTETYHSPDLVPPHRYLAFHAWIREAFAAHAVVHMGKHGNPEWLPGKALGLSRECFPEVALGALPNVYPFIVNDPGEGTQAKRRTAAVIVDHLTPPLTRAESYGPLRELEALVDEYYAASEGDPRRAKLLQRRILDLAADTGLGPEAGMLAVDGELARLRKLDGYLCELKEMQIRDGLHVFGEAPEGRLLADLVVALARLPRGEAPSEASLHRAIAADLGLGFDPLDCTPGAAWQGPRPMALAALTEAPWRTAGDAVERVELLASALVAGEQAADGAWFATRAVLAEIDARLRPSVERSGAAEIAGLLRALDGRFLAPGPSGAPTRGRPDVLPTGRNFFSVDTRAVPTETAWTLGRRSAELLCLRHAQDHGEPLTAAALTAWGTSNMRTGGDDIAQALALIGAKPVWDRGSGRVSGFEVLPLASLGRPRVDVTLRISGFFRDAFPEQIALFDRAARAVGALDEDAADNPLGARMRAEAAALVAGGMDGVQAERRAGFRVFGSKPGSYGAGLQALIDERGWETKADLAEAYLVWGSYAYGAAADGEADRAGFERRLRVVEAVVQNQDNREHDLLDSDDYYQFEGGMTAAVEGLSGRLPAVYHNDHSRPERPVVRTLEEEIGRTVRARAVNPKWLRGVMRHGYKGAFEIAATVDYLFAFAATTGAVSAHHWEAVHRAYLLDEEVAGFCRDNNPAAFAEMRERFAEAVARGLWRPRSNSAAVSFEESR